MVFRLDGYGQVKLLEGLDLESKFWKGNYLPFPTSEIPERFFIGYKNGYITSYSDLESEHPTPTYPPARLGQPHAIISPLPIGGVRVGGEKPIFRSRGIHVLLS